MKNGVLNVSKEKGYTSHDVVAKLRGITHQKKIGHTGTLDPDATGVLPVCLGKATKLCDMLTDKDKVYEAVLLLGISTDTQDISGTVLKEQETADLDESQVEEAILSFRGSYDQIPPMYSALKVNGKKLYELAREGKTVERKPRRVTISEIEILSMELPRARIRVECSKGTYIRTLCQDIGEKLGVGGCMEELIRTRVERFRLEDARTLQEIQELSDQGRLQEILIPVDQMFSQYPGAVLKEKGAVLAYNGNPLELKWIREYEDGKRPAHDREWIRVYDQKQQFLGIYEDQQDKQRIKLIKNFYSPQE